MNKLFLSSNRNTSANDLVSELQRASQSIIQMTADLKKFNNSFSNRKFVKENKAAKLKYSDISTSSSNFRCQTLSDLAQSPLQNTPKSKLTSNSRISSDYYGKSTITNFPFTTYTNEAENIVENRANQSKQRITSYHDGKQTIISFPFTTYTKETEDIVESRAQQSKQRITSYHDGKQTIINFPFTTYSSDKEELTDSRTNQSQSKISSYHDGKQTIINFPFTTYNQNEDITETKADFSKQRVTSYHDGKQTIINFPFTTYTNEKEDITETKTNQSQSKISSYHDGKQTIINFPFTTYTNENSEVNESKSNLSKQRITSCHDGKQTIINFPFTTYRNQTEDVVDNKVNQSKQRITSYFDGKQTIINFPFTTYRSENEDMIDNRESSRQQTQESASRKYYFQVQDLEYEEYENSANPSQNYKQIKYPYQQNWQRIQQAPEFILDLIAEQKRGQACLQQTQLSDVSFSQDSQQESYLQLSPQQETQRKQAVKFSNYIPKSSQNFLDETTCKSRSTSLATSYMNTVNYLPSDF